MMLQGKTALVTGASRGIGRQIALALAREGCGVALVYAGNHEAAQEAVAAVAALGVKAQAYQCDVAQFGAVKQLVEEVVAAWGGVDILVNNAGITRDGLVLSLGEADYDTVLDTNLKGAFNTIRHLSYHFLKKRAGRIINIASVAGLAGNPGQANYAAAKAGMVGLTKSVARELAGRGITCNAIAPGYIETDMTDCMPEGPRQALLAAIPARRPGQAREVAELAAFLAGPGAAYITGEVIRVDGGLGM